MARKVPRSAHMNQKEFDEVLSDLSNWGFDLDVENIEPECDNILGIYIDQIEEAIYDLKFVDDIYSKVLDLKDRYIDGPVYYKGEKITLSNCEEYAAMLAEIVEEKFAFIDHNIHVLKTVTGLIPV